MRSTANGLSSARPKSGCRSAPALGGRLQQRSAGAGVAIERFGRGPRSPSAEPLARLVAFGIQLRAGTITPQGIAAAVDIASSQGWRRPLLAWLGVQLKRAQDAGDSETAARLKRRIELVSG